jgi:hypothetical protein
MQSGASTKLRVVVGITAYLNEAHGGIRTDQHFSDAFSIQKNMKQVRPKNTESGGQEV